MIFNLNIENYPDFGEFGIAPCAESDPNAFYPVEQADLSGGSGSSKYYNESGAKAVCKECPYIMRCLLYAVENNELGIWGGTTELERKSIKRAIRSGATPSQIEVRIKR
jgi:WhiB family redox-sensing transcriptional regulator